MTPQMESIVKAVQTSDLLTGDIRETHKLACRENPLLEIVLRELIGESVRINRRLAEIQGCLR